MTASRKTRGQWLVLLATVLAMALTARLGWWQLGRAATKNEISEQWRQRVAMPALSAADLLESGEHDLLYRSVALTGQWVPQHTVFLDNRPMRGQAGFVVVTPLRISASATVLVQRGWVPRHFQDRTRLPEVLTPAGEVTVQGRVAPPPSQLYVFTQEERGPIRQNIALSAYAAEIGLPMLPVTLQQTGSPEDSLERAWPDGVLDVSKHHGYAFQWFALCALIGLLYVWFQFIAPRRKPRR